LQISIFMRTGVVLLLLLTGLSLPECYRASAMTESPAKRIPVGPGPEDMILDTAGGKARLIVSCASRRESLEPYGEIVAVDPETGIITKLDRYNEPAALIFRPHGIYLYKDLLYVISHEKEPDDHPILIYRLHGDSLEFREAIRTASQHSPNALVAGPDGEIYFVNDAEKRGSVAEKIFRLKRASLVRLKKGSDGIWQSEFLVMDLGYPAGINRIGDRLFVGDALLHRIHVYRISRNGPTHLEDIRGVRGVDNIRIHQGYLLAPGHVRPFRFIRHAGNPEKSSPVEVYLADPVSGKVTTLYYNDGSAISAGSTALFYDGFLYISQVFEPYIVKVRINDLPVADGG